jgi:signal transduction histidine kinase
VRLKTQFVYFTAALALVPAVFGAFLLGTRIFVLDPREPVRAFTRMVSEEWSAKGRLEAADIGKFARRTGFPTRSVALVAAQGEVLFSSIPSIAQGEVVSIRNLMGDRRQERTRPNFNIVRLDHEKAESPVLIYDIEPIALRQNLRNRSLLLVGSVELALLVVAGLFSIYIVRSLKKAIDTLERDARIVASGDLDYVVEGSGSAETRSLASSMNLMRLNLKDLLARQSRMLMGVSHDLKTPIALIQGYADALSDGVAIDAQTQERYVGIIREKSRQLEDLASELIDFLKLGQKDKGFSMTMVDPCLLGRSVGRRFEDDSKLIGRIFSWGFGEALDPEPPETAVSIPMNRALVERALDNLIGNAFRYSGQDGAVTFRIMRDRAFLRFEILDDGPGIPPAELPYVFDAFFRGSHARSGEGHGLGLTIVKATAELHGWTARAENRGEGRGGTMASLAIPLPPG